MDMKKIDVAAIEARGAADPVTPTPKENTR
jgi:hypothetical protein